MRALVPNCVCMGVGAGAGDKQKKTVFFQVLWGYKIVNEHPSSKLELDDFLGVTVLQFSTVHWKFFF